MDGWYTLEVDWFGNASARSIDDYALAWRVPIASTFWLVAIGLLGLFAVARKQPLPAR